eukprot:99936-Amphidinium_carterae.1
MTNQHHLKIFRCGPTCCLVVGDCVVGRQPVCSAKATYAVWQSHKHRKPVTMLTRTLLAQSSSNNLHVEFKKGKNPGM